MKKINITLILLLCTLLSACGVNKGATWIESKYMNNRSDFVSIDGNRVHFRDEGAGETIILIHGTASSLHTWDAWTNDLKHNYRVVRMDLPGFGLTGPDRADRYEVSDDVAFLTAFMTKLGIKSAHIVGNSLGGRIAWQYALDYPERVNSLTLINALGYPQAQWPPAIEMAQWPVVDTVMSHFSPRFMFEIGLKEIYFNSGLVTENVVDRYFELSRYPGNMAAFPKRVKARLDQDASLISNIAVPTLILWGEEDLYFPVASAHRFQTDIVGAQLHTYPMVGHLPMEEVPKSSQKDFEHFIQSR